MNGHGHSCGCCQTIVSGSTTQTLQELDFERGIWSAALNGDVERVEKLLTTRTDPNILDSAGYSALHYAARNGHIDVCKVLLDHGASVNACTRSGGVTPLQRAAYSGKTEVVKLLIGKGADVCLQDTDGKTALHKAVEMQHLEIAQILVKANKTAVSICDSKGKRASDAIPSYNQTIWESILLCNNSE